MQRKIIAGTAFALAALASTPAFSQIYVGAAGGISKTQMDCSGLDSCDNSDTAAKALIGYDFAKSFSAEATFYSLGKIKASQNGVDVDFKSSFWGLGVAFRPDFGNGFGGVARVGAAFTTSKLEAPGVSSSHDSTQPYVGLGLTYAVSKALKAELDWDNTKVEHAYGSISATATINAYVIGATYAF